MKSYSKKIYKALSATLYLKPFFLLIASIIMLAVMIISFSCIPAGKKPNIEPGGQSQAITVEQAPESNNYQGLRFETTLLESSRVSDNFPRLVCLGDSVTFGWNIAYEKSFPYLLEEKLREQYPEVMVINAGIGGQTVIDGLDRLDRDVFYYDPQVIIISFGLNDSLIIKGGLQGQNNPTPDQIEEEGGNIKYDESLINEDTYFNNVSLDIFNNTYRQLIDDLSEKSLEVLIMGTNPVMTELQWEDRDTALKQAESYRLYNQTARAIAEDYGLIFVDLQEGFIAGGRSVTLIQSDGVHPSEIGLSLISEILYITLGSIDLDGNKKK